MLQYVYIYISFLNQLTISVFSLIFLVYLLMSETHGSSGPWGWDHLRELHQQPAGHLLRGCQVKGAANAGFRTSRWPVDGQNGWGFCPLRSWPDRDSNTKKQWIWSARKAGRDVPELGHWPTQKCDFHVISPDLINKLTDDRGSIGGTRCGGPASDGWLCVLAQTSGAACVGPLRLVFFWCFLALFGCKFWLFDVICLVTLSDPWVLRYFGSYFFESLSLEIFDNICWVVQVWAHLLFLYINCLDIYFADAYDSDLPWAMYLARVSGVECIIQYLSHGAYRLYILTTLQNEQCPRPSVTSVIPKAGFCQKGSHSAGVFSSEFIHN